MSKIILVLKGILLWTTSISTILTIYSIDSIANTSIALFFSTVIVNILLILACTFSIKEEELLLLSGYNWLENTIGKK